MNRNGCAVTMALPIFAAIPRGNEHWYGMWVLLQQLFVVLSGASGADNQSQGVGWQKVTEFQVIHQRGKFMDHIWVLPPLSFHSPCICVWSCKTRWGARAGCTPLMGLNMLERSLTVSCFKTLYFYKCKLLTCDQSKQSSLKNLLEPLTWHCNHWLDFCLQLQLIIKAECRKYLLLLLL